LRLWLNHILGQPVPRIALQLFNCRRFCVMSAASCSHGALPFGTNILPAHRLQRCAAGSGNLQAASIYETIAGPAYLPQVAGPGVPFGAIVVLVGLAGVNVCCAGILACAGAGAALPVVIDMAGFLFCAVCTTKAKRCYGSLLNTARP